MSGTPGFVYVLSNPSMPGIVKIGRSARHPELRAIELYKTSSGVPEPFVLEFAIYCKENHEDIELEAHETVHMHRVNGSREFFRVTIEYAIEQVSHVVLREHSICVIEDALFIDQPSVFKLAEQFKVNTDSVSNVLDLITQEEADILSDRYAELTARVKDWYNAKRRETSQS